MINDDDIDILARPAITQAKKYEISPDAQVLPTLASMCECELLVKDNGTTVVLFTQEPPEDIEWAEYDVDLSMLTFVTWSGKVMGLGMPIHKPFRKYLKMAKEITMVHMIGGVTPGAMYPAKLIQRHIGI